MPWPSQFTALSRSSVKSLVWLSIRCTKGSAKIRLVDVYPALGASVGRVQWIALMRSRCFCSRGQSVMVISLD